MMPAARPMKKAMPRQTAIVTPANVDRYLADFEAAQVVAAQAAERVTKLKENLRAFVIANGEEDDKGSLWVTVGDKRMKNERRASTSLDRGKAEAWLKRQGMWDDFKEVIEQLDEDKLLAAGYDGTIPKRTFDGFSTTRESFAFKVV